MTGPGSAIRVLGVLEDVHPRAIVQRGEEYFVVSHPSVALSERTRLPKARAMAALAKQDYESLKEPLSVESEAELERVLAGWVYPRPEGRR